MTREERRRSELGIEGAESTVIRASWMRVPHDVNKWVGAFISLEEKRRRRLKKAGVGWMGNGGFGDSSVRRNISAQSDIK